MPISKETMGRIYYEDELFKCLDDIRKARNRMDLQGYGETVLTLYDFLIEEIRKKVRPKFEEIQKRTVKKLQEARANLAKIQNPLEQAGYYAGIKGSLERENADDLLQEILQQLDKAGFLLKRREIDTRTIQKKE